MKSEKKRENHEKTKRQGVGWGRWLVIRPTLHPKVIFHACQIDKWVTLIQKSCYDFFFAM